MSTFPTSKLLSICPLFGVIPTVSLYPAGLPVAAVQLREAVTATLVAPLIGDVSEVQDGGVGWISVVKEVSVHHIAGPFIL